MLVITFFLFFSFSITAQFSEQFKISIQERVDLEYTPSIAVGVIDSNGMHFYNYGKTKNENGKSVDEQTIYEIGSISKVFTSFLLAKMVEEGKMSLDDPIDKYLISRPEITFFKTVFKKYTNFSISSVEEYFEGNIKFNE